MDGTHASLLATLRLSQGTGRARARPNRLSLQGFDPRSLDHSMLGATIAKHMQLGSGRLRALVERLRFNAVAIRITGFSAAVRATVEPPTDVVTFGFVLQATEPVLVAGQHFHVDMLTVFGAGEATEIRYPAGSRSITLAIPANLYAEEIASSSKLDALQAARGNPGVRVQNRDLARLRDVIAAMEQLGASDPGLWLDRQWAANAERALLEAFFRPLSDPTLVAGSSRDRLRTARAVVLESEAKMDADRTSIPSVATLCSTLGISRRTLERAFHDLLGMSPARYLRLRALNAVREQLLQCQPGPGMVTRTAIDNGFWHLGRFSLSYRELFGERPIDTLRQTRRSN